jgi:hypothetical protein
VGYHLAKGDCVSSWCGIVSFESSATGWFAHTIASQYQTTTERKLINVLDKAEV